MGVRGELQAWWLYLGLPTLILAGYVVAYDWKLPFVYFWLLFGVIPRMDEKWSKDWLNPTLDEIK